jgi:DNA-binding NtrC family response regulator
MSRPRQVLIVDDEEDVRESVQYILDGLDCAFTEAEDGAAALAIIAENDFDVIFLDLRLGDLSGIDVLRQARTLRDGLGEVIIMTGLAEPGTEAEAEALGAFEYLRKPLDYDLLRQTFSAAVSGAPSAPAPASAPAQANPETAGAAGHAPLRRVRARRRAEDGHDPTPSLLVLDDDPGWLDTMEEVLGNDFDLALTSDPDEACERAQGEHFALVVLDKLLGSESGLDVLTRMRRVRSELRAIILTRHPDHGSAFESAKRGALGYVSKGDLDTLPQTVRTLLADHARPKRVFLSYDRADREAVYELYDELMLRGFLPWMDEKSILPGKKWEREIRRAIDRCDYFVFCLSATAQRKEGVLRKEVRQALQRQEGLLDDTIFFITARLANVVVEEPFNGFQYVDLYRPDGLAKLLTALSSELEPEV